MRLSRILDDRDAVTTADLQNGFQVCGLTVKMDRENRSSSSRDLALDLASVHRVGGRIDVNKHRSCAGIADRPGGRNEGHGNRDDLVPRPDPCGDQRKMKSRCTRIDPHTVLGTDKGGERLFERDHLWAQDIGRALGDLMEGIQYFLTYRGVLGLEVQEGNRCFASSQRFRGRRHNRSCQTHARIPHRSRGLNSRAGTPATIVYGAMSLVTTAPAPTNAPAPMVTPPRITAPLPIEAPRQTRLGNTSQSDSVWSRPSAVARGSRSLMNMTPWPTKTSSSIVTPSQTNVWL